MVIFDTFHPKANSIMQHKIPIQKNLPYLTDDELNAFDESKFIKNASEEQKQFELEYIIDLKISRRLYDNWDGLATTIISNTSILTPEDTKNIYDDGVYNLTVIALKQMPLEKRAEFLKNIINKTQNRHLKKLFKKGKCDNEKLLTIRPVLKQYENKVVYDYFCNLPHGYRMPRTTDRCEVFQQGGQNYLGYQETNQRIKTNLSQEQIKYLFGEQRPNGHQAIENCWLVSELKHIKYDPGLKLFIMSRFSMDADENVIITLKNGKKVTFKKDIVDKATKITKDEEHLSPAMACLSLLAALNRTRETVEKDILKDKDSIFKENIIVDENYLKTRFKRKSTDALKNKKSLNPLTDNQDPLSYALKYYNDSGSYQYESLISLFFNKKINLLNARKFIKRTGLYTFCHAWSNYGDTFAANPQNSNTLFKKGNIIRGWRSWFYSQDTYYVPKVNPKTSKFYS